MSISNRRRVVLVTVSLAAGLMAGCDERPPAAARSAAAVEVGYDEGPRNEIAQILALWYDGKPDEAKARLARAATRPAAELRVSRLAEADLPAMPELVRREALAVVYARLDTMRSMARDIQSDGAATTDADSLREALRVVCDANTSGPQLDVVRQVMEAIAMRLGEEPAPSAPN